MRTSIVILFVVLSASSAAAQETCGYAGGADVEIALGRHASLLPAMRVHWVKRTTNPSDQGWFLGLDTLMFRPALGLRARF